jgi:hypothetical protein
MAHSADWTTTRLRRPRNHSSDAVAGPFPAANDLPARTDPNRPSSRRRRPSCLRCRPAPKLLGAFLGPFEGLLSCIGPQPQHVNRYDNGVSEATTNAAIIWRNAFVHRLLAWRAGTDVANHDAPRQTRNWETARQKLGSRAKIGSITCDGDE